MHLRSLWCLFLLIGVLSAFKLTSPPRSERKQLAGPPSEFADMMVPSPEKAALRADSAIRPFTLAPSRNGEIWSWEGLYPIDAKDRWTLTMASPFEEYISIYLAAPGSSDFTLLVDSMFDGPDSIAKKSSGPFGIDGNTVPTTSYTFFDPPVGTWTVLLNTTEPINQRPGLPHGYLILDNESEYKLLSHLNSYENMEQGKEVGLVVRMYQETAETLASSLDLKAPLPAALQDVITSAKMEVILPNGNEVSVPMHDDGNHYDLGASDGVYGATIQATSPGEYILNAVIAGTNPIGQPFERTTQHLIQVTPPEMTLTGLASSSYDKSTHIVSFFLDVDIASDLLASTEDEAAVRAYAEVWGTSQDGLDYLPVAWVQAIVDPEPHDSLDWVVRLDMNDQWVQLAEAFPPFQLRNVALQDVNTNGVLSLRDRVFVEPDQTVASLGSVLAKLYANPNHAASIVITEEMQNGPRPAKYRLRAANETGVEAGGKLMLVHGYCSSDVWPSKDFPGSVKFQDFTKSRSQDEFAKLILNYANSLSLPAFSIVGHSQGGLAALHLKSYYWSGLDTATDGYLIQSVGSPYSGCSLAGSLADIGSVFGVGCSANTDLATDGASLWLSKVPKDKKSAVYFYLTMYDDAYWISSACVTGSSLVMYTPNDGTCEQRFGQLEGAHNMGMKKKYCHVTDMKYPPQCEDVARNAEMNKNAAH